MIQPQTIETVSKYLQIDAENAEAILVRAESARARMHHDALYDAGDLSGNTDFDASATVVALIFSRRALRWLQAFSRRHTGRILVLKTPLTEAHFIRNWRHYGALTLVSAIEMVRDRAAPGDIYVTFPEHSTGGARTSVRAPFFGETMLFQALESTLARKHSARVLCFDGGALREWKPGDEAGKSADEVLSAEAASIAAIAEGAIRCAPDEYFGWEKIESKTLQTLRSQHLMRLGVLEGFLRSWISHADTGNGELAGILEQVRRQGPALIDAEIGATTESR